MVAVLPFPRRPVDSFEHRLGLRLVGRAEQDQTPAGVHGGFDGVEHLFQVENVVGLVHDGQRGGVRAPACGAERHDARTGRELQLVRLVRDQLRKPHPVGQAHVHLSQTELQQLGRLIVALAEQQHRSDREEQQLLQGEGNHQPGETQLAGLEDDDLPVVVQFDRGPLPRRPEAEWNPCPGAAVAGSQDVAVVVGEVRQATPAADYFRRPPAQFLFLLGIQFGLFRFHFPFPP